MPGLLDLPAELIEQIYLALIDLSDEEILREESRIGQIRLSCRYAERATRRSFRDEYFPDQDIRRSSDAEIESFCVMSGTPDLAKSVQRLSLTVDVDDDGTTEAEQKSQSLEAINASLTLNGNNGTTGMGHTNKLDQVLPAAYSRHRDRLLTAFRACENMNELEFTDCDMWRSAECLSTDYPKPRPKREPPSSRDCEEYLCDISSTFDFFLSLAEEAGLSLKLLTIHSIYRTNFETGLTNAASLVTCKRALRTVEQLELVFIEDWRDDIQSAEDAGIRIGQQLRESIDNFPVLTKLILDFTAERVSKMSLLAWAFFAQGSAFPALEDLDLRNCSIWVKGFASFVSKHRSTLKKLTLCGITLFGGSKRDIQHLCAELAAFPKLESLSWNYLYLYSRTLSFPAACAPKTRDMLDEEEGYVWVLSYSSGPEFTGLDEVRSGLRLMAEWVE